MEKLTATGSVRLHTAATSRAALLPPSLLLSTQHDRPPNRSATQAITQHVHRGAHPTRPLGSQACAQVSKGDCRPPLLQRRQSIGADVLENCNSSHGEIGFIGELFH